MRSHTAHSMKVPAYLEGSREWFCPLQLDSDMAQLEGDAPARVPISLLACSSVVVVKYFTFCLE